MPDRSAWWRSVEAKRQLLMVLPGLASGEADLLLAIPPRRWSATEIGLLQGRLVQADHFLVSDALGSLMFDNHELVMALMKLRDWHRGEYQGNPEIDAEVDRLLGRLVNTSEVNDRKG